MKTVIVFLTGAIAATGLVLACSDDSPRPADAATCDCPAAEPPIAGRVTRVRGSDDTLPANSVINATADCPASSTLVTGWCDFENLPGTPPQLALVKAGATPALSGTWQCTWHNYNGGSATVHAEAVCLVPAQ